LIVDEHAFDDEHPFGHRRASGVGTIDAWPTPWIAFDEEPSRAGHGGPPLTSALSDVGDEFLRSGLEVAFAVALAGTRLQPPVAAPGALRPFLRFQKLPAAALTPLRRAVESDDEFRERVAVVANDDLVDRASWLWIHRPEGWDHEVLSLWDDHQAAEEMGAEERAERSAQKRLDAAERTARRAQADLAATRGELDRERTGRRDADAARAVSERRSRQLDVELGGARRRLRASHEARAELEDRVESLEAALRQRAPEPMAVSEEPGGEGELDVEADVEVVPSPGIDSRGPDVVPAAADPIALANALGDAASATARLAEALEAAHRALIGPDSPAGVAAQGVRSPSRRIDIDSPRSAPAAIERRRAIPLPLGLLSDSPEAVLHLLRVPDILVLVDGYNVAKLAWPSTPLPEQRRRLLELLVELTARHPTDVRVVFDGGDVTGSRHGGRHVRVAFSPPGVTADDVLVEQVERTPPDRPVLVITSDRALGESVRALGANVVRSPQFLASAHRRPGPPPAEADQPGD
jgi:predicted RNA-binding protein with PIN domain